LARRSATLGPRRLALLVAVALCTVPVPVQAWGFAGHRMVARKALSTLPDPLRKAFEANADYLVEQSITPDLQRSGPDDPDHFLDMEVLGAYPFADVPRAEPDYLARFGKDAAAKGRVPWKIEEVYRGLVDAFRRGDLPRALERAGTLCHLAADVHVPLHATENYDGQLTGQRGLHARWESDLVERNLEQLQSAVQPGAAQVVSDPWALALSALRESYLHSLQVLASDRESVRGRDLAETPEDDRYDDAYYSRFWAREGTRVAARLSASASATGSLWRSAWEEAGKPALDESYRVPYVRHHSRVVLLSLDGSAAPLLDDAVARGVMPNLAALRHRGASARGSLTTRPSKTAPGHAALYTGAWSDRNGITGNEVSPPEAAITDTADGYSAVALRAEPIWAAAARQDVDVTVVSATHAHPFSTYVGADKRFPGYYGRKLTLFDGYHNLEARDRVYAAADLKPVETVWLGPLPAHEGEARALAIEDLGLRFDALVYDDPRDPVHGFDTLYLTLDGDPRGGVTLKPLAPRPDASAFAGVSVPLAGADAAVYFRLFALSPDGSALTLYRTAPHVLRSNKPRLETAAFDATGGFVGNGAGPLYERGGLGPPLWDGGDGTAERRYLETVALVVRQLARLDDFALDRTGWELLLTYLPYPDEALHVWYGYLDPALPRHDRALAARLRPFLDEVLRLADTEIGHLVRRAGDAVVAVAGDHGFVGVDGSFKPNLVLRQAGLLALDAGGHVDLARTRAYYAPGQFVLINRVARAGGIVRPEEEDAVRRDVAQALRGARGGGSTPPVVLDVLDPRTAHGDPTFGGPAGGDLYLSMAPGYSVSAALDGAPVETTRPRGDHFLDPERPAMHAGFALAGSGVAEGAALGEVRQVDVAPTLCLLLGIEPPAQAVGSVLTGALARRQPMPPWR